MIELALSNDAQATALLVGRFGSGQTRPLSRSEFNRVAQTLHQRGLRPADLFKHVPCDLPIESDRISGLISRGTALALAVDGWGQMGIRFVSRADSTYPARFKRLLKGASAPIIYYAGELNLLDCPTFGVVGSRDATGAGLKAAQRVGERAANEGVVIVSGDARGIDRTAMEAALDAGGRVIGILADSLAKSVLSKRYRRAIIDGRLLLLSHTEPDARFTVAHAMERNRYIYAASDAVLVADSDVKGGTWNGALENLKNRWTLAYVRVDGPSREGNTALAREGLLEWPAGWFETKESLTSLFSAKMGAVDTLPLFTEDELVSKVQSEILAGAPIAGGPVEAKSVSAARADEDAGLPKSAEKLSSQAGMRPGSQHGSNESAANISNVRDILFDLFLDRLADSLSTVMPTGAIAAHFAIEVEQAQAWLTRASILGKVMSRDGQGWEWLG